MSPPPTEVSRVRLDEESQALMALMRTWVVPPLELDTLEELRAVQETNLLTLSAPGDPVAHVEDHRVLVAGASIGVRVYRPRPDEVTPALLYVHGGGWIFGSVDLVDPFCRDLASRSEATVVSVEYRLAPEHPFPTPLEDIYAALEWVVAHADELGIDPQRIAVAGESAGGNLAAALTLLAMERGGPAIAAQVLLCPVLDASMSQPSLRALHEGYALETDDLAWAWDRYRGDAPASDPLVSPSAATLERPLPPTSIVVAECDPLRDEALAYGAKLAAAGTDLRVRCWAGQLHAFFLCTATLSLAPIAVDQIARDVRELLDDAPL